MKAYLIVMMLCLSISSRLSAQSYHFSQFFSTPLLTNPANTGFINGPYRLAGNFRSQGKVGGSPYFTGYLSADVSPLRDKLAEGHKAGLGIYIMNDQSLSGALQTNAAGFSAAYHVGLDEDGYYSLGVGLQGTYHQRTLNYNRLSFDNQFTVTGYNPAADSREQFNYDKKTYMDVNAGLLYSATRENGMFFAGLSVYNILKHKEHLLPEFFKIPTRYTMQAGGYIDFSATGSVYFSLTNMSQSKASETTAGLAYGFLLAEEPRKELNVGLWYRHKDALIPYIGYLTNGFQLGLSYDYTISSLKTAAQVRNGYELTLLYNAPDLRERRRLIPWD